MIVQNGVARTIASTNPTSSCLRRRSSGGSRGSLPMARRRSRTFGPLTRKASEAATDDDRRGRERDQRDAHVRHRRPDADARRKETEQRRADAADLLVREVISAEDGPAPGGRRAIENERL